MARRHSRIAYDGHVFDSKGEMGRYQELVLLVQAGQIRQHSLRVHPEYVLMSRGGEVVGTYKADFAYTLEDKGEIREVVEDYKGTRDDAEWRLFRWKARHFAADYGIEITVVGPAVSVRKNKAGRRRSRPKGPGEASSVRRRVAG